MRSGIEGILNGRRFTSIVDNTNPEKIKFDIVIYIGILDKYRYYAIEELPEATAKGLDRIGARKREILIVGVEQSVVEYVLIQKEYLVQKYKYLLQIFVRKNFLRLNQLFN